MGSIRDIIASKNASVAAEKKQQDFKVEMIHYTKLYPSEKQFYSEDEVKELADLIVLSGGIKQNLLVRKLEPSKYEVIAGHKRRLAAIYNVERGYKEYEFLPCKLENTDDLLTEFNLIITNSSQRERSEYEKMEEATRLKKLIPLLVGDESIKGRALRKYISEEMKVSETKVAQFENIHNNLSENAMEKFRSGEIGVSVANELAGVEKEQQEELIQKDRLSIKDVKEVKKEQEEIPGQMETGDYPELLPVPELSDEETIRIFFKENERYKQKLIQICSKSKNNTEAGKKFQELVSPYGIAGWNIGEHQVECGGFGRGITVDGRKITYIQFVRMFIKVYIESTAKLVNDQLCEEFEAEKEQQEQEKEQKQQNSIEEVVLESDTKLVVYQQEEDLEKNKKATFVYEKPLLEEAKTGFEEENMQNWEKKQQNDIKNAVSESDTELVDDQLEEKSEENKATTFEQEKEQVLCKDLVEITKQMLEKNNKELEEYLNCEGLPERMVIEKRIMVLALDCLLQEMEEKCEGDKEN